MRYRQYAQILLLASLLFTVPGFARLNISDALLDKIGEQYNRFAKQRVSEWRDLVDNPENHALSDREKLELVNSFFNANVQFLDDIALWQKKDYWATPLETLSIGGGDCEDYSIAKYFTLKELGVDEDKLRITYVKAVELGQAHMVLTYFKTKRSVPLVLDNLIIDIKPASQRHDLVPVYSFNGTGLWLAKSRGEGQRVGESSKLSLWNDLEKRMQDQISP
jgi:predicted transglutaminase-like cysteine proteinase